MVESNFLSVPIIQKNYLVCHINVTSSQTLEKLYIRQKSDAQKRKLRREWKRKL